MKLGDKIVVTIQINGSAYIAHQLLVIIKIVNGIQTRTGDLVDALQMMQITTRKMLAGITTTGFIKRLVSSLYLALRILISPKRVNSQPLRALRVGMTQSNVDYPPHTPDLQAYPPHQITRLVLR